MAELMRFRADVEQFDAGRGLMIDSRARRVLIFDADGAAVLNARDIVTYRSFRARRWFDRQTLRIVTADPAFPTFDIRFFGRARLRRFEVLLDQVLGTSAFG